VDRSVFAGDGKKGLPRQEKKNNSKIVLVVFSQLLFSVFVTVHDAQSSYFASRRITWPTVLFDAVVPCAGIKGSHVQAAILPDKEVREG